MGVLKNIAQGGMQPELAAFTVVTPVNENTPGGGFIKTAGQIDKGGFSRTRLSNNGYCGTRRNMEAEILQNVLIAIRYLNQTCSNVTSPRIFSQFSRFG